MIHTILQRSCMVLSAVVLIILPATPLLAQQPVQNPFNQGIEDAKGVDATLTAIDDEPVDLIRTVVKFFLSLVAVIAAAAIIWGGFVYITSIGNDRKIEQAKTIILYAIIGLMVIGISAVAVNAVLNFFK